MGSVWTLIAAVLLLAAGPLLSHAVIGRVPGALAVLEGFVFTSIGGLVLLHILPESVAAVGWWTVPAALVGLVGPLGLEQLGEQASRRARRLTLVIALAGLALHSSLDGIALSVGGAGGEALSLAVLLHQVPVGLALWWLARPALGARRTVLVFVALAAMTTVGFALGGRFSLTGPALPLFSAIMGGSLIHVLGHRSHTEPGSTGRRWSATLVGAVLGAALLVAV